MLNHIVAERYRLEEALGSGGMATVWRARDEVLGRPVAVKLLAAGSIGDASAVERFRHEANTVAGLGHANIVTVFDAGMDEQAPFLVMELIEGTDLGTLIERGPLPVAQAVSVAEQVCAALQAAHRAGVVHRDIKPANLLLTGDGSVKVVDFGIARTTATARAGLTATATVVGTSSYMAPEQAAGGEVDSRVDLYALGCVLHAMLAGQPPFTGGDPLAVLYQHLHEPPQPLRALRPDVPAPLEQLVLELLAKDPGQRPSEAGAVRERLAAAGGSVATAAFPRAAGPTRVDLPPVEAERPSGGGRGRRRVMLIGAAACVVAAVAGYLVASPSSPAAGHAAAQTPTAGAASPALPTPVASSVAPSPTPSAPQTTQASPRPGTMAAVLAAIARQEHSGNLSPDAAQQLRNRLRDISQQLAQGRTGDLSHKIMDLRHQLTDLQHAGQVTPTGVARIDSALSAFAAAHRRPSG